jgi:hypothetical protein|tara:strand:- start:1752 stop:2543 length:792 start_codon:yes stop_codon:yes gene_type:complete
MAFNVNDLKSAVSEHGFMRPDTFLVTFTKQTKGQKQITDDPESLTLFANAVNVGGISFDIAEIQRQGFGPLERRAKGAIFPPINITFMMDGKGMVYDFLYKWSNLVMAKQLDEGEFSTDPGGGFFGEVGYYDDYICDIDITMFGDKGRGKKNDDSDAEPKAKGGIMNWHLYDAWPQVIPEAALGWKQTDEILEVTVQFTYRAWNASMGDPVTTADPEGRLNLFQFLSKMKGAYEIAKTIKKPRNVQDAIQVVNNAKTLGSLFD